MDNRTRHLRKARVRSKISGTSQRPRASVYRSLNYISLQLIDDETGKTILSGSTRKKLNKSSKNLTAATKLGQDIAAQAKKAGITNIVFDRNGYKYHGKIKALADSLRASGLDF